MGKSEDLTGKTFGKLTVLKKAPGYTTKGGSKITIWTCQCNCADKTILDVRARDLKTGHTQSCGCLRKEKVVLKNKNMTEIENEFHIWNDIVFVKYTNCDEYFICDLDDWEKLKKYAWRKGSGYAIASSEDHKVIRMHRLIMNAKDKDIVDHEFQVSNGICDNRKSNLKLCNTQDNARNHKLSSINESGVIGVNWRKDRNKWRAYIALDRKQKSLGLYEKFEDAVVARLKAELKYFGEFAPQKHLYKEYGIVAD